MNWRNLFSTPPRVEVIPKPAPPPIMDPCQHQWGKWSPYLQSWQRRDCTLCGITSERSVRDEIKT